MRSRNLRPLSPRQARREPGRRVMIGLALMAAVLSLRAPPQAPAGDSKPPQSTPGRNAPAIDTGMPADAARTSIGRGIKFLLDKQNADGSWGTSTVESLYEISYSNASFYAWKLAGGALSCMALMMVDETPERRAALDKAVKYVLEHDRPRRGSDWDIDNNWA